MNDRAVTTLLPKTSNEDRNMRQNSRQSRDETTIAVELSARSLSRAIIALVAIGGLAACSADQNLPSAPKQ